VCKMLTSCLPLIQTCALPLLQQHYHRIHILEMMHLLWVYLLICGYAKFHCIFTVICFDFNWIHISENRSLFLFCVCVRERETQHHDPAIKCVSRTLTLLHHEATSYLL
jgi:hypothetical protein